MLAAPSEDALLAAWEESLSAPPALGAMALLAVARPDLDPSARGALSVGARNAALLELRGAVLGPSLSARADCPACGESLELELALDELDARDPETGPFELAHAGWQMRYRLLRADDLAELASGAPPSVPDSAGDLDAVVAHAQPWLVARCLLAITSPDGEQLDTLGADVPEDVIAALAAALGWRDPLAELLFDLTCPACGQTWQAELDVPAFVSEELHAWGRRLLHDMHLLASAYGWTEPDILSLSPARRRAYLELVLDGPAAEGGAG